MRGFFKKNRTLLIMVLLVVVVASAFVYFRNSRAETATQFQTATIERGSLTATIGATGTVRAKQTAVLIWQAAGTVENVHVNVGDTVLANEELAELANTSLPQSVILAQADLVSAQKALADLLSSNTAQAEALVALRDAKEAYTKAENWRNELENNKIDVKEIIYKK